ncbi:MAG: acylphosphatase [Nanoarchaeota archaeon]|nr:acylphosphatase [Nanoarchaeota archaeon]MBU1644537.1 acylphosphatase [Nanoarchaeota archaeon]MBU1976830.1 acylphosphatase [Nanoarchaeota archaeon]
MKKRLRIKIKGHVQGVFFRHNIREKAFIYDLKGWVRNSKDGSVEAVFEGEKERLEKMLKFCKAGPIVARIDEVKVEWSKSKNEFETFEIIE